MALFVLTTFLGAGLLFAVEPMVAKMLLSRLGGSPAVWNTAMVFFQAALLAGYAFAHFSTTRFGLRRHPWVQVAVIASAILLLPIGIDAGWHPPDGVAGVTISRSWATTTTGVGWVMATGRRCGRTRSPTW
jgi:hypothetical protein